MNVFLSYSHQDSKWAKALGAGLRAEGFGVTDPGNDFVPGENWYLQLGKALGRAEAMIVLLSPDSVTSQSVNADIEYGLSVSQFRGRLIPVLLKPTAAVPWILEKQQVIRATKDTKATIDDVIRALKRSPVPARG